MEFSPRSHQPISLRELPALLGRFMRNPIETMRSHVTMTWPAIVALQVSASMLSGAIVGILSHSWADFFVGLLVFPLANGVITCVFALFLAYFFSFFQTTFLDFKRLYSIVVLANVPYFLFHALSGFLPPLDLLGFALVALLLIVGLVEQFSLQKKIVVRLIGGLAAAFCIIWIVIQIQGTNRSRAVNPVAPQSLDQLEKEMRDQGAAQ